MSDEQTKQWFDAARIGDHAILGELISAGADVNARDPYWWTALHFAAWKGYGSAVRVLIDAGADIDARDRDGRSPLHLAAFACHSDVVQVLVAAGADLHARDARGRRAIDVAPGHLQRQFVLRLGQIRTNRTGATSGRL